MGRQCATTPNNPLAARLASLVCPTYIGPSVTPLAEQRKRMRRQGLTLRVTRRCFRGHDAVANASFCHALVEPGIGQERRATATGTLGGNGALMFCI
jgi:hypothetical protein